MIVIADDITGAAEIAGIAFSQGQQVRLVCGGSMGCGSSVDCGNAAVHETNAATAHETGTGATTVIATDTRSMTEAEAVAETRRIVAQLLPLTAPLFKKTDSALRGHVVAELAALLQATGYRRAVYLPANPSKGRIIRARVYYIKVEGEGQKVQEVPIHQTAFSYDPEFPAHTSVLTKRFPDAEAAGIIMPDATSLDDIRRVVGQYDDGQTLFAGAADLFKVMGDGCWVMDNGQHPTPNTQHSTLNAQHSTPNTLILCGSTQSKPIDCGIPIVEMPRAVYDGEQTAADWLQTIDGQSLILTIPHTHRTGKDVAVHLRTVMAEVTRGLVARHCPDHLIIEGGATAWATLQALGWTDFDIERQIAPGVVQMRSVTNGTLVTLKPGSYPWGGLF